MTQHELIQAAAVNWDLFIQSLMVYITVISGYLIAAFLVGNQLTRQQLILINSLFVLMEFFAIWGILAFGIFARDYMDQITSQQIMAFKFRPHYMAVPLLIIKPLFAGS